MSVRVSTATLAALVLGLAGCGPSASRADSPILPVASQRVASALAEAVTPSRPAIADGVSVPIAALLELAAQANPNRQILDANRAAATAIIQQAGAWANPELELGIGRTRAREAGEDGVRSSTTVGCVGLKQRFELPGKRAARVAAAEAQRAIAEREAAVDRLDLEIEIRSAALAVASAAAHAAQTAHAVELSAQVSAAVEQRMRAGETDRGDLARALVDLANAQLAADAAQAEATAARAVLRAWCGDALPERFAVTGILPDAPTAVALADLQRRAIAAHPRLAVFVAQRTANIAAIAAEDRAWHPDLTLGVSGNREADTNDLGISVGFDLPLWNRNAGAIAKAQADLSRIQAEQRGERLALQRQVVAAWGAYERERRQIAGLSDQVIPAAQEALTLKLASFQAGEATLLEVIDARRSALSAETALTEARERAAQACIDLVRAVGGDPIVPIPSASPSPTSPAGAQP